MRSSILVLGGLAALGAVAPAHAVTGVQQCQSSGATPTTCAITFADGVAGTFRNSAVSRSPFTDIFTLDVATNGFLSITLTSSYAGDDLRQDIDFSSVSLVGPGVDRTLTTSRLEEPTDYFSFTNLVVTPGQYSLSLTGTAGQNGAVDASYSGTLNFSAGAVPEPSAWAMLALGFGLVGASVRSRRSRTPARVTA